MGAGTISLSVVSGVVSGLVGVYDTKKKITIGRVRGNKFQIKSDTVSSKHAVVSYVDGAWFIIDCDSSNGTSVNGISVVPGTPVELKDGDTVEVGVGGDNIVRVKIEVPGKIDLHVQHKDAHGQKDAPVQIDAHFKKSALSSLTVKQWIEEEMEKLAAEAEALADAVVKELSEAAEQAKKDVRAKAELD